MNYLIKSLQITGWMSILLTVTACVAKSVYPYYTQDAIITLQPSLEGVWQEKAMTEEGELIDAGAKWTVSDGQIQIEAENQRPLNLYYTTFQAGDDVFINLVLMEDEEVFEHRLWLEQTYYIHTLWKVLQDGERFVLVPLDEDWLLGQASEGKISVSYVGDFFPLFTATSEEWKVFLDQYWNHEEAFSLSDNYDQIWLSPGEAVMEEAAVEEEAVEEEAIEVPAE